MILEVQIVVFLFGARAGADVATLHIHPKEKISLIGYYNTIKSFFRIRYIIRYRRLVVASNKKC